jgi:hypothetical protein
VDIRAAAINFYSDRLLLAAHGAVRVHAGSRTIFADSVRYDLMHDALLAVGNVHVVTPHDTFDAAAYALDLATQKATVLELDPLPTTLALSDDRFTQGVEAPAAPGTFAAADLGNERPYIRSTHVSIVPGAHVRFTPAHFPTGSGASVPSPSYLYTFAPNPNFFVPPATLPAFSFDQPYELLGSAHSLLAGHLRYGTSTGVNLGLDEHLVDGLTQYAVGSYLLTGRRFDAGGFQQLTPHLNQTFSGTLADGINAVHYALQQTSDLFTSTLSFSQFEGDNDDDLQVSTTTLPIGHLLFYKLSTDYGFDAIEYGTPYSIDLHTGVAASLFTPTVRGPLQTNVSGQYLFASEAYDYPHQTGSSTAIVSLSRALHATLLYTSASFAQYYDRYGLPPPAGLQSWWGTFPTRNGAKTLGYGGISTARTYYASAAINPNPNFNLLLSLTGTHDFPQFDGYGRAPLTASFDLRIRPVPNLAVEYGRSYLFGWDSQHFIPQYTLSVSP